MKEDQDREVTPTSGDRPPANIYTSHRDKECECPCCAGIDISFVAKVEVGPIWKEIVADEISVGEEKDHKVEVEATKTLQVNFQNDDLNGFFFDWQHNTVRVTIEAKAYFEDPLPDQCCAAGEGAFSGTATIQDGTVRDTTSIPLTRFPLQSCQGTLCCRSTFSPKKIDKSYSFPGLPRIRLKGWIHTQVSTYERE